MTRAERGSPIPSAPAGTGRRDANLRLLRWRLFLAVALTLILLALDAVGGANVSRPGAVASLGLLFTSLAVSWAALQARAPERLLLISQLAADTVCLGLLVNFSGGPYSAIPLVFCVPILLAASFLDARWSMATAGLAAILTGGGHFGLALGWLLTGTGAEQDYLSGAPVLITALHMSVFVVTGMIAGELARKSAQRREAQLRTERQILQARAEVRSILDNIKSGLITVDRRGVVTRVNPAGCRLLRMPESQLLGQSAELVMADGLEELAAVMRDVAAGGEPVHRGEVEVRREGKHLPLGLNVTHATGPRGEITGAIAVFADLTREKELVAQRRETDRLAAIGELAASIAHEIRNPLASIRGSVELLAGELELAGYQRQLLELVLKESGRVNTIINDFLAYSRMRPPAVRSFPAAEFRDEITLLIEQHVAAKGGQVRVSCDVTPPALQLTADPAQLTQLALNLAINACQAMGYDGRLRLAVNLVDGGRGCELVVTDNGPGIDPDIRDTLFAPFKTTKEGGTGLGLSVVARIANAHGGTVRAEDAPSGGAIFRVRWPLSADAPTRQVGADRPDPAPVA